MNQPSTLPIDKIVICQEDAVGFGGKLDCLRHLFDPDSRSSLLDTDDRAQVLCGISIELELIILPLAT